MIQLRRITQIDDPALDQLVNLYILSFPEEERRDLSQLNKMIQSVPNMFFNAVEMDGELCGLAVYWDFDDFYYLEHLAVFPEKRNHKLGGQVLNHWRDNLKKMRIMEVEPAEDELTTRRVKFYQRNGYQILDKDYVQLSYRKDEGVAPLWIMASDESEQLPRFVQIIKDKAYREPLKFL